MSSYLDIFTHVLCKIGEGSLIAAAGSELFDVVRNTIEENKADLSRLEDDVREQMSGPKKKRKNVAKTAQDNKTEQLYHVGDDFNLEGISDSDSEQST